MAMALPMKSGINQKFFLTFGQPWLNRILNLSVLNQESSIAPPFAQTGRILAIDFGLKRVGLAITDPLQIIAQPFETVTYQSRKELVRRLVNCIREREVVAVVIGLPRHMDGREGEMAKNVRELVATLQKAVAIPLVTWDERLSTVQAERALREMGKSARATKRGEVDQLAAVFILQSYMDSLKRIRSVPSSV